ncbi:sialate O-acetylesterase [Chryseobacterium sp.]|uniref:sialate O-acetylesterase n=1 Tax=Chryseobacterium sp. TaxID=1871047 RepID=UPI00388E6372
MNQKLKQKVVSLSFGLMGLGTMMEAKIKLPALVSDGMVLQRDQKIKIWGKADSKERVFVQFQNKKYHTIADINGNWQILLPSHKAGGPYTMTINEITLKDILVGDVWLASGQSNMELPMYRVKPLYEKEFASAYNKNIRFFTVPQKYNFKQSQVDISGGKWESTSSSTIASFSAVAYFFAKNLNEKYNVPIGILHSSLGGSPIQAWMDPSTLKKYPDYLAEAEKWKSDDLIKNTESNERNLSDAWYAELNATDLGLKQNWTSNATDFSSWKTMSVPGSWEDHEGEFEGIIWLKKEIVLPTVSNGKTAFLNLGRIKDADETYINGVKVGNVTYEYPPRWYKIPEGVLKDGRNIITVRAINGSGRGEFVVDKPYYLEMEGQKIDLKGNWKYNIGSKMNRVAPGQTFIRWKPTGLYNAMIHPLINYNIRGTIWYQGESNTGKPQEYGDLLTTMISDWRTKFEHKDMPFIVVQLSNFMVASEQPIESNWAELRDQQRKVSQKVSNTGLVVSHDIGEWNDIHPLNKKSVGDRVALQAQKISYNEKITADGPVYQSAKFKKGKAILTFENGTDDFAKVKDLNGFAIQGDNGKWVWAKAKIKGNKLIVWADEITQPKAVRYAWADNPDTANLKNTAGLPASSFTTEN